MRRNVTIIVSDDVTGEYISGAMVNLIDCNGLDRGTGTTNSEGMITFGNVPDGVGVVTITKCGYESGGGQVYIDEYHFVFPVHLNPGIANVTVCVKDDVTGEDITELETTLIDCNDVDQGTGHATCTTFWSIPHGEASVRVKANGYYDNSSNSSVVGVACTFNVRMVPRTMRGFTVRVNNYTHGGQLEGVSVLIIDSEGVPHIGITDSNGEFSVEIPSDDLRVWISLSKDGWEPCGSENWTNYEYTVPSNYNTLIMNGCEVQEPCPAPIFNSITIDNSPIAGEETSISWTTANQPPEVTSTEYYVYIFNNTKSEQYYDDIVDGNSLLITYPTNSVGDDITVQISAWNWCNSDDSETTTHEETVIPVEPYVCPTPIIVSPFYSPNPPFAGLPFEIDISVSNPQDSVYYEYVLADASLPFPLSGTDGSGYGDSTFHDEIIIPEEHAEVEAYLVINATNICGSDESEPTIWTSPNFTIIGVACDLHFVLFKPTRYLEEDTDLIFEGKSPNVLPDTATVKVILTKPDLTTYEHIIESVESCTQNDFNITFPYSEELYGNWTTEIYNNDTLVAPVLYIQILTEEEWELKRKEENLKTAIAIASVVGIGAISYMLLNGDING